VYPAVRRKVSDAEAQRALGEHAEAEETMKRLENLRAGDSQFDTELATLMQQIRDHVAEEEGRMFADMRRIFSPEELVELGAKVEAVKKLAPTRPHPSAPDTPPGDKILGPVTGLLDRMRDAVTGRGHSGAAGSPSRVSRRRHRDAAPWVNTRQPRIRREKDVDAEPGVGRGRQGDDTGAVLGKHGIDWVDPELRTCSRRSRQSAVGPRRREKRARGLQDLPADITGRNLPL